MRWGSGLCGRETGFLRGIDSRKFGDFYKFVFFFIKRGRFDLNLVLSFYVVWFLV